MRNYFFILFLFCTLAGCTSSIPYQLSDSVEPTKTSLKVVDNRFAEDIDGGLPLLFDPTYSVPDDRFSPPLIDMLRAALEKEFGDSLSGKTLTLDHFSVDNDFGGTYARNQSASMAANAAVNRVIMVGESNDKNADTIIVRIKGDLDGKGFATIVMTPYSATPPVTYMGMVYDLPESRVATKLAVRAAIKQVIDSLQ